MDPWIAFSIGLAAYVLPVAYFFRRVYINSSRKEALENEVYALLSENEWKSSRDVWLEIHRKRSLEGRADPDPYIVEGICRAIEQDGYAISRHQNAYRDEPCVGDFEGPPLEFQKVGLPATA